MLLPVRHYLYCGAWRNCSVTQFPFPPPPDSPRYFTPSPPWPPTSSHNTGLDRRRLNNQYSTGSLTFRASAHFSHYSSFFVLLHSVFLLLAMFIYGQNHLWEAGQAIYLIQLHILPSNNHSLNTFLFLQYSFPVLLHSVFLLLAMFIYGQTTYGRLDRQ